MEEYDNKVKQLDDVSSMLNRLISDAASYHEAIKEIERLRSENEQLKQLNRANVEACDRWNDRLRSEIEQLQNLRNQQSAALEKAREALEFYLYKLGPEGKGGMAKEALTAIEELKK